jgi:hypothetical protein
MAKDTVEGTRNLDVLYFQRNACFLYTPGIQNPLYWKQESEVVASMGWVLEGQPGKPSSMRLIYTATHYERKQSCNYSVRLTQTTCNYGGSRWWFVCPLSINGRFCGRRCRFLYLPFGADYFGCRKCYDLAYDSQQQSGSFFYETVSKPLSTLQRLEDKLARVRSPRRRAHLLARIVPAQLKLAAWMASRS